VTSVTEIEKFALELPDPQRAQLATHLLESLPPAMSEQDDGVAEALRRDADLDAHPDAGISLEEYDAQTRRRRS